MHCERAEHDFEPHRRLSEEQFEERGVAPNACSEHVAVYLEVHQPCGASVIDKGCGVEGKCSVACAEGEREGEGGPTSNAEEEE